MPAITSGVGKDELELYTGYDHQKVGLGMMNPDIYKTPGYSKKKVQKLVIGGLSRVIYAGMEHDQQPLILPMVHESAYNTILAYNLNYLPRPLRQAMLKYVLDANANRIKSGQPIIVDYHALKRAIKESQYVVRRYKIVGLNVRETIPLVEWPEAIQKPGRWSGHYKKFMKSGR